MPRKSIYHYQKCLHERQRPSFQAAASRSSDAMHIVIVSGRLVVIDDMRDADNIQSASRHVGRHQYIHMMLLEEIQCLLSLRLRFISVNRLGFETQ